MRKNKREKQRVLITDAHERISLYAIRSLGRKGIEVGALSPQHKSNIGFLSRYCKWRHIGSLEKLSEISKNYEVLLPISLNSINFVLENAHVLDVLLPPLPSLSSFHTAIDKEKLLQVADKNDIPIPKTYTLEEIEKAKFPLVIKYRIEIGSLPVERHVIVRNKKELDKFYKTMSKKQNNPLIQEFIDGEGYGFFALYNYDAEQRAIFCHRRLREEFPSGGPSTYCESVYIPQIMEYGSCLLDILEWKGLAMVEFKRDKKSGEYKLMEINPRIWGSTPLAITSGVDFPYLWYRIAVEGDIKKLSNYKKGVRVRFLFRDLVAGYLHFRESKNKIKYLKEYVCDLLFSSYSCGILARDDPLPAIKELESIGDVLKWRG